METLRSQLSAQIALEDSNLRGLAELRAEKVARGQPVDEVDATILNIKTARAWSRQQLQTVNDAAQK